jgi:hypothetical protein
MNKREERAKKRMNENERMQALNNLKKKHNKRTSPKQKPRNKP